MRTKLALFGSVALIAFVACPPAIAAPKAAEREGLYFGLEGGWGLIENTSIPSWGYGEIKFDDYAAGFATLGYGFEGRWRLELEAGYRTNDLEQVTLSIIAPPVTGGTLEEWSAMLNALADWPLTKKWVLSIGGGLGADFVQFDDSAGNDDDATVFGAQAIGGLTYRLNHSWDMMVTYRALWATNPELTNTGGATDELELFKQSVTFGLRYGYNDPPPPPPPPAPPPPAPPPPPPPPKVKQFIVFFGFNKCAIETEADKVLTDAAATVKSEGTASIKVVGHTDTSGSNAYNQRLSECRANAVKTNLVAKGVDETAVAASGKGETELMVQTGDAVKEPQNRRATVDLE